MCKIIVFENDWIGIGHFTVVYSVTKPLIWSEGESDLVVIELAWVTFEKQEGLYHNKVNLSLTRVQRFGNQAHSCEMDYCEFCICAFLAGFCLRWVYN